MKKFLSVLLLFLTVSLFALGVKDSDKVEQVVVHKDFTLGYDEDTECPLWVQYTLSKEEVEALGSVKRKNNFRSDPDVATESASKKDYMGSGYDRGHLFPAYHASFSETAMSECFYMSNMVPQIGNINRGCWKNHEMDIVILAEQYGDVERICGPVFHEGYPVIGENEVGVPVSFYSIISYFKNDKKIIECYIVSNIKGCELRSISLDNLRNLTELDFIE